MAFFINSLEMTIELYLSIFSFKYFPCIYNRLLLNILYVINQKYGLNL